MNAVVQIAGKQYMVSPGDTVAVSRIEGKDGEEKSFSEVLLTFDGEKTRIGTPFIKGAHVSAVIKSQKKGEKMLVRRFKSKVRYRRARGFRPYITELQITEIS